MKKKFHKLLALAAAAGITFTLGLGLAACGESAYDIAVKNGFQGTEQEWLESLKGENGKDGKDGKDGATSADGVTPHIGRAEDGEEEGYWYFGDQKTEFKAVGEDGKSAYEVYVAWFKAQDGNAEKEPLSEQDWLASLKGEQGAEGQKGPAGESGPDGKSAYDVYVEQYKKEHSDSAEGALSEEEWLASLRGTVWFSGTAAPEDAEITGMMEGDFYLRTYSGFTDIEGYEIYRYEGGNWVKFLDMTQKSEGSTEEKDSYYITDLNSLLEFRASVEGGKTYEGKTVYLEVTGTFDLGEEIVSIPAFAGNLAIQGTDSSTSIIQGMLAVTTSGTVTAENVTFQAETGTQEGNYVLNVNAQEKGLKMTNCVVKRLSGNMIPYGTLLYVTGDAELTGTTIIAPITGTAEEIYTVSPSTMHVTGKLTMTDGTVATNGYGFFDHHVTNAAFNGVTFCGLDGFYTGEDVTVKTLYIAINSTAMEDITFDGCTIKDCRDWAILAAGAKLTVNNCTFEDIADQGIVFAFGSIQTAEITGNTFNLNDGFSPVTFKSGSVTANTQITVTGNTVEGGIEGTRFLAETSDDLTKIMACLNSASTQIDGQPISVRLDKDIELNETLTIDKTLTLCGLEGETPVKITTTNNQNVFSITAADVTIENIAFEKTNTDVNVSFAFIVDAQKGTIKDCTFTGQYHDGNEEVVRAVMFNAGVNDYLIEGNEFTNVRQPSYLEGNGTVKNNTVKGTRGFVVICSADVTFENNTFTDNAEDIAIIPDGNGGGNIYTLEKAIELSKSNNNAYVDVQPLGIYVKGNESGVTVEPKGHDGANVSKDQAFLNVLQAVKDLKDHTTSITVKLSEGTYTATANEQFKLEADNVRIEGTVEEGGEIKTTIDASTFTCSGQAGFEVSGNGCSIENVKITCGSDSGDVSALKVTKLDNETDIVEGFTLKNAVIEGNAGHGLNLHGVNGEVTIDTVTITKYGKCGISIAKATGVKLINVDISNSNEKAGWADIGFMYKENSDAYKTPCEVSIDFKTCTFGQNVIYSERPSSAEGGADVIKNGETVLANGNTVTTEDGKTLTMTVSEDGKWGLAEAKPQA